MNSPPLAIKDNARGQAGVSGRTLQDFGVFDVARDPRELQGIKTRRAACQRPPRWTPPNGEAAALDLNRATAGWGQQ